MRQSIKNLLLIVCFSVLIAMAYHFSFSKTLKIKRDLEVLKTRIDQKSQLKQNIIYLKEKEILLDSIIAQNRTESTSIQNNLLKVLNSYSDKYSYKVINFKEPHIQNAKDGKGKTTSFHFTLEGEYRGIEKLLYQLESQYSFGSIEQINFEKKKDYRQNKSYLQCSILVQNVE